MDIRENACELPYLFPGQTLGTETHSAPWFTKYSINSASERTRGPTQKNAYVISKSFDFIEIKMISSDFNKDFRLQKSIECVGDSTRDIFGRLLIGNFIY